MAKGGKTGGSMDKASSVSRGSMKMRTHVATPTKSVKLDMTKSHPMHEGKQSKNPYSAYDAN